MAIVILLLHMLRSRNCVYYFNFMFERRIRNGVAGFEALMVI